MSPLSAGGWPLLGSIASALLGFENQLERALTAAPPPVGRHCCICLCPSLVSASQGVVHEPSCAITPVKLPTWAPIMSSAVGAGAQQQPPEKGILILHLSDRTGRRCHSTVDSDCKLLGDCSLGLTLEETRRLFAVESHRGWRIPLH